MKRSRQLELIGVSPFAMESYDTFFGGFEPLSWPRTSAKLMRKLCEEERRHPMAAPSSPKPDATGLFISFTDALQGMVDD